MPRTKTKTYRLPFVLDDAMAEVCRELGYANPNQMIVGLIRYALLALKPHKVTAEWSRWLPEQQDQLDDALLALARARKSVRGTLLEHVVARALGTGHTPGGAPSARELADAVLAAAAEIS